MQSGLWWQHWGIFKILYLIFKASFYFLARMTVQKDLLIRFLWLETCWPYLLKVNRILGRASHGQRVKANSHVRIMLFGKIRHIHCNCILIFSAWIHTVIYINVVLSHWGLTMPPSDIMGNALCFPMFVYAAACKNGTNAGKCINQKIQSAGRVVFWIIILKNLCTCSMFHMCKLKMKESF